MIIGGFYSFPPKKNPRNDPSTSRCADIIPISDYPITLRLPWLVRRPLEYSSCRHRLR